MTSTSSLHKTPLAGKEAFLAWLSLAFQEDETIWLKFGHDRFFTGSVSLSGHLSVWATRGSDKNRRKTIYHTDGYDYLSKLAESVDGGAFYIPGKPSEYPLKEFCLASDDIGGEMDDGTAQDQWERIELIAQLSGLIPGYIISSGGKSAHPHWKLTAAVPMQLRTFYSRLMAIALLGDPAVTNPHQPMRVPGFFRKEKNKEQTLQFYSDFRYTAQEFEAGMQRCFENLGLTWWQQEQFSDSRWRLVRKILVSKQPRQEKEGKIRELLAQPEVVINPPQNKPQPITDFQYSGVSIPLEFFLSRSNKQLLEEGQSEGDRDNSGFRVASDLIGVADALPRLNINYQGDARQLFEDFAARCSPAITGRDIDRIWRSASRGTPSSALPDDIIISRAAIFQRQQIDFTIGECNKHDEPDVKLYDEYIQREELDERISQVQEFRDLIYKSANKIKRFLDRGFKGFGQRPVRLQIAPKVLKIKLGEVPTPSEYEILGKPRLEFKGEDRLDIWAECAAKGWKHILDSSGTGSGKSHAAGEALPSNFGVKNIWYFAADHRNPTTLTIESRYTDLPVRNNGFKIDKTRQTPLGRNFRVWAKQAEISDTFTIGNCDRTHLFHALAEKNISVQQSETSPICKSCPHFNEKVKVDDQLKPKCSAATGTGFGFRAEYSSTLFTSELLRAHPNSAPQDEYDYSEGGAFWDEAGNLIETQSVLEVKLSDLQQTYHKVVTLFTDTGHDEFRSNLEALWQVLTGLLDPSFIRGYIPDNGRFGMNDTEIRGLLPDQSENLDAIIEFLNQALQPDLSFLASRGDQVDFKSVSRQDKRYAWAAQQAFNSRNATEKSEKLKSVLLNWFVPFLIAWRDNSGYFKREFGSVLKIYSRSHRHTDIASSMKWNIYLDATLSPEMLGDMLDTEDILHIKQEMPSYKNLRVIQVTGMGRLSADRRESADLRVTAALAELQARHLGLKVIDWKAKATDGQGYHFRDGRGINRFQDAPALALVGIPCPNIGGMAIKYQLLKDKPAIQDSPEFAAFVDQHIQSEITQEAGRLRANLRPNEELTLYFLGDYNLDFLKEELPLFTFEQKNAFELTPEAGDKFQRTKYGILKAFQKLIESGTDCTKITQDAIANVSQITRSRISQIASEFGGWSRLRKMLILLYRNLYNKTNNPQTVAQTEQEPDSDLLWLAHEYLPLLAINPEDSPPDHVVKQILEVIQVEGEERFKIAIQSTDKETKLGILVHLTALLTTDFAEEGEVLGG